MFALLCPLAIAQSCKSTKDTLTATSTTPSAIDGYWVLEEFNGKPVTDSFKGTIPTLNLDVETGSINGNAGCNNYFGRFTYEKGVIKAPNLASTMMMCVEENQENQYMQMFESVDVVQVSDSVLSLSNSNKAVAKFVRGLDLASLAGKTWQLETIDGKDASSLFGDTELPTLQFDKDQARISGHSGCNRYNVNYVVDKTNTILTISPAMMTRMACPNMQAESQYINALVGTVNLKLSGDNLVFIKEGKPVLEFILVPEVAE